MIIGLQYVGILFGLVMIYFTFLYYKRREYDLRGFITWMIIWVGFIVLAAVPSTVYGIMQEFHIQRTVDFFVISGFLIFSVIIFRTYAITKKNQKRVEILVRKIAHAKAKKEKRR